MRSTKEAARPVSRFGSVPAECSRCLRAQSDKTIQQISHTSIAAKLLHGLGYVRILFLMNAPEQGHVYVAWLDDIEGWQYFYSSLKSAHLSTHWLDSACWEILETHLSQIFEPRV